MRAYTVSEIDALREVVQNKWLFGSYSPSQENVYSFSRSYSEGDKVKCVEELVRTWMLAGKTAEDLYASER